MQQEDDLRGLAKIMDFMRAVSIILVVMNVYWYCYTSVEAHGINIGVVDRILLNFNREAGLFRSILYTKLFVLLLLALSCLGTKGVKGEKITWPRIWAVTGKYKVYTPGIQLVYAVNIKVKHLCLKAVSSTFAFLTTMF